MAEEEDTNKRYGLRKRRRTTSDDGDVDNIDRLLEACERSENILVFSGSGLSATSGMSTFSTKGGLYERAQKEYRLVDGKTLFTYSFYNRQPLDAQAFFADIYVEAQRARPAPGHRALRSLAAAGRLLRHYTLNIDGLAERAGMGTWHPEDNPKGLTVEMHGNVHFLVCPGCSGSRPLTAQLARQLRSRAAVPCGACDRGAMRFKVMLYDDAEGDCITPDDVMDQMEADVKAADLILWVGISFQQSASTTYFRNVRHWLAEASRGSSVLQALVNPSDEALWNLRTASSNQADLNVVEVLHAADDVLPLVARRLGRRPKAERAAAAAEAEPAAAAEAQPAAAAEAEPAAAAEAQPAAAAEAEPAAAELEPAAEPTLAAPASEPEPAAPVAKPEPKAEPALSGEAAGSSAAAARAAPGVEQPAGPSWAPADHSPALGQAASEPARAACVPV